MGRSAVRGSSSTGESQVFIEITDEDVIILMRGGKPLGEKILMWWNFIARTNEQIVEQRTQWNQLLETAVGRSRFGVFEDNIGGWIPAPELPNVKLQAR